MPSVSTSAEFMLAERRRPPVEEAPGMPGAKARLSTSLEVGAAAAS